jgi:hypothetical protein
MPGPLGGNLIAGVQGQLMMYPMLEFPAEGADSGLDPSSYEAALYWSNTLRPTTGSQLELRSLADETAWFAASANLMRSTAGTAKIALMNGRATRRSCRSTSRAIKLP